MLGDHEDILSVNTMQVASSAEEPDMRVGGSGSIVQRNGATAAAVCEYRINSELSMNDDSMSTQPNQMMDDI
jgi:hypothetical protein